MKKLKIIIFHLLFTILIITPFSVLAHPGRTDSSGCHTCRKNCAKWGLSAEEYHCHKAKALPQPIEPVKSKFSETGGATVPAPEYKQPVIKKIELVAEVKPIEDSFETGPVFESSLNKSESTNQENTSWIVRFFKFIFSR